MGNILALKVHRANSKPFVQMQRKTFVDNIENILGLSVDISPKIKADGFHVIPQRWGVERTFAWLNHSRRLAKDLEKTVA